MNLTADLTAGTSQAERLSTEGSTATSASAPLTPIADSGIDKIWANSGEDKVAQAELRASQGIGITSSVWNGSSIRIFGARNEVVSFNLVLEVQKRGAGGVAIAISSLRGPDNAVIGNRHRETPDPFWFTGRNIETFLVRYLQLKGISTLTFNYWADDKNELNLPQRLRRPHGPGGEGQGNWQDRPDHDAVYPDIAVPIEIVTPFSIDASNSQSIWVDVYIPKTAPPGLYRGQAEVSENGVPTWRVPIELDVRKFALPDLPTAKTMLFVNADEIDKRYLGSRQGRGTIAGKSNEIVDRHFQLAHRHRISLIDSYAPISRVRTLWSDRLTGALFTPDRGYDGPGVGVGNNVYSIGTYTTWPWQDGDAASFQSSADAWVNFFESLSLATPTDYFLYLLDESAEFAKMEKWSQWIDAAKGPGQRLRTLATVALPDAVEKIPSIDIVAATPVLEMISPSSIGRQRWRTAFEKLRSNPARSVYLYNGARPLSGTFAIDDHGIAPRQLGWLQYKLQIDRWFVWESTYYTNFQYGMGQTNVFKTAHSYGERTHRDPVMGDTGPNYDNGNGVLFYPGTDKVFPDESYGLAGPLASLRLKYWRRGLQDHDYLVLASKIDPARVREIVGRMIPNGLWDVGEPAEQAQGQPGGWSANPDDWEHARRELADIIERAGE